jgi:hypothetical protein
MHQRVGHVPGTRGTGILTSDSRFLPRLFKVGGASWARRRQNVANTDLQRRNRHAIWGSIVDHPAAG